MLNMKDIKNTQNICKKCFHAILVAFICDLKIDLIKCKFLLCQVLFFVDVIISSLF